MPVYTFTFPEHTFGGKTCTITDTAGTTVHTETLSETPDADGAITLHVTLDEGVYVGTAVRPGFGTLVTQGTLDIVDSIAEGGGVGASETAYFVATGPADVTDGAGAAGNLTFVADDRHGALPSWASIVSGDIVLSEDAGTCAWAFTGLFDYDFSATTPPDSAGAILSPFSAVNPVGTTPISADDVGDGQDDQTSPAARAGGITLPGTFTVVGLPIAYSDDQITPIPDGTATPRVALTVTRIAQAAVLPE